jgi:hypothetical protein
MWTPFGGCAGIDWRKAPGKGLEPYKALGEYRTFDLRRLTNAPNNRPRLLGSKLEKCHFREGLWEAGREAGKARISVAEQSVQPK